MKRIASVFMCILCLSAQAQQVSEINKIGEKEVSPGNILYQLPEPPPKTVGSYYLNTNWTLSSVTFVSGLTLTDYPMRFDLKHNLLEVRTDNSVKVIRSSLIKRFVLMPGQSDSSVFVNTQHYYKTPIISNVKVMQLLYKGNRSLYKHSETYIQPANYNQALNLGEKDNKIKITESYYLSKGDELVLIEKKTKKNQIVFGNQYDSAVEFAKKNKLKLDRESDIIMLLHYLENN